MDRTANLISEMKYFGIELKPIKFRHSNANYNIDRETNSIYKGVSAVKFCNEEVGNKLYDLRDKEFDSFLDIIEIFPGNSRQLEILIKLGYFDCFGKSLKLIKLCDLYDLYGGKKIIKKDKCYLPLDLVHKYAVSETAKQYRFDQESMRRLLREFSKMIPDTEIPLRTRLEAEAEFMGYISYANPKLKSTGFVLGINTKYTPRVQLYMLDTGKIITVKVSKQVYQKQPFDIGNIIRFITEDRPRNVLIDGKWTKDYSQTETWISKYIIKHTDL
jgi:DNA polymerase-3 subunit alpha